MNEELRLCPQCGGEGKLHAGNRGRWKYVECTVCGYRPKGKDTYLHAIEEWNREEGK